MGRSIFYLALVVCSFTLAAGAQSRPVALKGQDAELKFVVYVRRHGVRSPTGKPEQYNVYSNAQWPAWEVAAGYLTPHGYKLMEQFGAWDRTQLVSQGLLKAEGCEDAAHVTIHADSDQRTRETGKALASALFPGCTVAVQALAEGTPDPLFHAMKAHAMRAHAMKAGVGDRDFELAAAALGGRIGGDPGNLTEAYRPQLAALDQILSGCGTAWLRESKRSSLFEIPAKLGPGSGDKLVELRGPLNTAATLTENLLLEYTQGMDAGSVGWGCVDGPKLRSLMELHTGAADFGQRTAVIARAQGSNLLDHIRRALQQAATGKQVAGAPSKVRDRALFLVGHDTNLANIAGMLNLTWIADGRRDDTPPGATLIFELWRTRSTGSYFVQSYYSAQSLEQMRTADGLTAANPPLRVGLYVPGCSREELACSWPAFSESLKQAVEPRYVDSR